MSISEKPVDAEREAAADKGTASASDRGKTADRQQRRTGTRLKMIALGAAVLGMVLGSVVDRVVQGVLDSSGVFGPGVAQILEEQVANFNALKAKLAELAAGKDPAERERLTRELTVLLAKQEQLAGRTHEELRQYSRAFESLRQKTLATQGVAGGADFHLRPGEAVSVGNRNIVLSLQRVAGDSRAYVNLSGKLQWLSPGDFIEAPAAGGTYRSFNKGASTDEPSRIGFDLVRDDDR